MNFRCKREVIEYLIENIGDDSFKNSHVRPQFAEILKWLYPNTNWKRGICKDRQIKHMKAWLDLHDFKYDKEENSEN